MGPARRERSDRSVAGGGPRRIHSDGGRGWRQPLMATRSGRGARVGELDDGAIGPNQQLDGEAWEAPFFYQDRRHAFYVTAEERLVLVPEWTDPGVQAI